jgi:DNA primase
MSANSVTEEIKSKLDIVQVISEYLQLHKAGVNFKAPCPFHSEKTPSFMVSPERQRWHCFGCGEDGDIFTFVEKIEGVDFVEARKHLAKKAGVALHYEDEGADRDRRRLLEVNQWAARYYHEVLLKSQQAERARAYVKKRQLKDETVDDFVLGYAPDSWDTILNFLRKKGFKDDEIFRAGLVSRKERGDGYYDRFRNRLMFPIRDAQGNFIGFTGRVMPDATGAEPKDTGKYVNTQETAVYHKSSVLYGLDRAKQEIRHSGIAIVVEGNMDVIASHQAGVRNVVASSGTAFTADQLVLLKRLTDKLVLSFDMDAAGELAARRSIDAAVVAGFEVRVLRLPPDAGKDPDDCIRKDPAIWSQAIAQAAPFMDWFIDLAKKRLDFSDPYAKSKASEELLAEVAKLSTPVERAHWFKRLSELFQTTESALRDEVDKLLRQKTGGAASAASAALTKPGQAQPQTPIKPLEREQLVSQIILGTIFNWPELAETVVSAIKPEYLDEGLGQLYRDFVIFYNEQRTDGGDKRPKRFPPDRPGDFKTAEKAVILQLLAEKELGELSSDERSAMLAKLMREIKKLYIDRRKRELSAAVAQAQREGDDVKVDALNREANELIL